MAKTGNALKDKPYSQIWLDHLARMLDAHYSPADALRSHRMWKMLGKQAKANRL